MVPFCNCGGPHCGGLESHIKPSIIKGKGPFWNGHLFALLIIRTEQNRKLHLLTLFVIWTKWKDWERKGGKEGRKRRRRRRTMEIEEEEELEKKGKMLLQFYACCLDPCRLLLLRCLLLVTGLIWCSMPAGCCCINSRCLLLVRYPLPSAAGMSSSLQLLSFSPPFFVFYFLNRSSRFFFFYLIAADT